MTSSQLATRIHLLDFRSPPMRAFHLSWIAFFFCFFAWFAAAPLMAVIRKELHLTASQVGNVVIASVGATALARIAMGWLCDRFGARRTYAWLLILGALPVGGLGLAKDYPTFLLLRLAIGAVGASFVITQYHTCAMFARNCVGTANAMTAGWGNMGGGACQLVMPLLFGALTAMGLLPSVAWRVAMLFPAAGMVVIGILYIFLTQDTPEGNRSKPISRTDADGKKISKGAFIKAAGDYRVWALAAGYGLCFGLEITLHNVAALYFSDHFGAGLGAAGVIAGSFGMMALFSRALGGWLSDRIDARLGIPGRGALLAFALLGEGVAMIFFSQAGGLFSAIALLLCLGFFVQIACGATYAMVPFLHRDSIGAVAGIIGAGGNIGAVLSGLLFRGALAWPTAMLVIGVLVAGGAAGMLLVPFAGGAARPDVSVEAPVEGDTADAVGQPFPVPA